MMLCVGLCLQTFCEQFPVTNEEELSSGGWVMTSWLLLLESWFTDKPFQVCGLDWEPTW